MAQLSLHTRVPSALKKEHGPGKRSSSAGADVGPSRKARSSRLY